jgi:hypothetical protein
MRDRGPHCTGPPLKRTAHAATVDTSMFEIPISTSDSTPISELKSVKLATTAGVASATVALP